MEKISSRLKILNLVSSLPDDYMEGLTLSPYNLHRPSDVYKPTIHST